MNEKDIQSFSLATLIDVCGRRPGDICYDGCLIASRRRPASARPCT